MGPDSAIASSFRGDTTAAVVDARECSTMHNDGKMREQKGKLNENKEAVYDAAGAATPTAVAAAEQGAGGAGTPSQEIIEETEDVARLENVSTGVDGVCPEGAEVKMPTKQEAKLAENSGGDASNVTEGTEVAVLRGGRLAGPTFEVGDVSCHDVTSTSVRVTWPKRSGSKYPVYGYRVCTAEVGRGFEVTYAEASSSQVEATIVGLKPGKIYQFHIATISAENMIVPGSSIVSSPLRILQAAYEQAWFFEECEDGVKWSAYEGPSTDSIGLSGGGGGGDGGSSALDAIRCVPSRTRCYTGLRSLRMTVPPGLMGGAFINTTVKEGWLYVVKARVFHEEAPPTDALGLSMATRLVLWDMRDVKEASMPAKQYGEWEVLECQIVPLRSKNLRIAIHTGGDCRGNIYVDAVELFHGGPTPAERAISSIVGVMDAPKLVPSKVSIRVESADHLKAADTLGTSDPFVKVFVGNAEVARTKVIPVTLSPSWNETFEISPARSKTDDNETVAGGIRFEIWDHDTGGNGDYLGEVRFTDGELATTPPHRVEHPVVNYRPEDVQLGKGRVPPRGGARPTVIERASFLALAVQVSWPEDPTTPEGKLVASLQNEKGSTPTRVTALKDLSRAALQEPRNIEDAAKAKEALLRARAAQAAVYVLSDPVFLDDSCNLLVGLVKLAQGTANTEAGFNLCRSLRQHVLSLSPAVVAVHCLRASVGQAETLLGLLAKLYVGQQAELHEDVVSIKSFFYYLVLHIETVAPAQALMREISGGKREFSPGLTALFRRYRTRIPALPGLWRVSILKQLSTEEALPPDAVWDDLEANEDAPSVPRKKPTWSSSLVAAVRGNLPKVFVAVSPLWMVVVGAKRVDSEGSCEQPVGTIIMVDGLLLCWVVVCWWASRIDPGRFRELAGARLFPVLLFTIVVHVSLVVGLLLAVTRVDSIGGRQKGDGKSACSSGTLAWGIFFLTVNIFCLVAPPVIMCVRCWDKVTKSPPPFVIPEEEQSYPR